MLFRHNDDEEEVSISVYQITSNDVWCANLPNIVGTLPLRHIVFEDNSKLEQLLR